MGLIIDAIFLSKTLEASNLKKRPASSIFRWAFVLAASKKKTAVTIS